MLLTELLQIAEMDKLPAPIISKIVISEKETIQLAFCEENTDLPFRNLD